LKLNEVEAQATIASKVIEATKTKVFEKSIATEAAQ
jgi:hypothetical protein